MPGLSSGDRVPIGGLYTNDIIVRGFAISNARVDDLCAAAEQINTMLQSGHVKSRIGRYLPLRAAADAHRLLENESTHALGGRIVIHP